MLVTGAGGVIVGLGVGWLIGEARRRASVPIIENTISLLSPFLAYIPADRLGLSGVLATVAVGLYLGRRGPRFTRAASRVQAEGTWTMVQFLLESSIFMLVGLELPYVLHALGSHSLAQLIGYGAVVTLAQKLLAANKGRWTQATTGSVRPGQETYVYGRANAPCRRCGALIQREMQGDRVTLWCPVCQPLTPTPAKRPATSRPS